jgi:hypothetical protein
MKQKLCDKQMAVYRARSANMLQRVKCCLWGQTETAENIKINLNAIVKCLDRIIDYIPLETCSGKY